MQAERNHNGHRRVFDGCNINSLYKATVLFFSLNNALINNVNAKWLYLLEKEKSRNRMQKLKFCRFRADRSADNEFLVENVSSWVLYPGPFKKLFMIVFTVWYLIYCYNFASHTNSRLLMYLNFSFGRGTKLFYISFETDWQDSRLYDSYSITLNLALFLSKYESVN